MGWDSESDLHSDSEGFDLVVEMVVADDAPAPRTKMKLVDVDV